MNLAVDAFNLFNRPNVDEVTSVYGSPVFCGTTPAIPRHYNDGISRAIQAQSGSTACPVGDGASHSRRGKLCLHSHYAHGGSELFNPTRAFLMFVHTCST